MEKPAELAQALDALLPQTQCRQCGYPGCRPYAEAIAARRAGINQCPPGGDDVAQELAMLAGVEFLPVDRRFGEPKPRVVAVIDESVCIGCTLCVEACPVDAIAGASKLIHTVIAEACTGCELCIPPCPVDCIDLNPARAVRTRDDRRRASNLAKLRFERRNERLASARRGEYSRSNARPPAIDRKIIERAVERARTRLRLRAMPPK